MTAWKVCIAHRLFYVLVWRLLWIRMAMPMSLILSFLVRHWAITIADSPTSRHPTHADFAWCLYARLLFGLSMYVRFQGNLTVAVLAELATNSGTSQSWTMLEVGLLSRHMIFAAMDCNEVLLGI
jgi:hypothetical protein